MADQYSMKIRLDFSGPLYASSAAQFITSLELLDLAFSVEDRHDLELSAVTLPLGMGALMAGRSLTPTQLVLLRFGYRAGRIPLSTYLDLVSHTAEVSAKGIFSISEEEAGCVAGAIRRLRVGGRLTVQRITEGSLEGVVSTAMEKARRGIAEFFERQFALRREARPDLTREVANPAARGLLLVAQREVRSMLLDVSASSISIASHDQGRNNGEPPTGQQAPPAYDVGSA